MTRLWASRRVIAPGYEPTVSGSLPVAPSFWAMIIFCWALSSVAAHTTPPATVTLSGPPLGESQVSTSRWVARAAALSGADRRR